MEPTPMAMEITATRLMIDENVPLACCEIRADMKYGRFKRLTLVQVYEQNRDGPKLFNGIDSYLQFELWARSNS